MSEKRRFPLNNPLQEKSSSPSPRVNKTNTRDDDDDGGERRGVSKGGRERVRAVEAIVQCQMCGRYQKVVFAVGRTPEWHRCIGCHELQPTDGYIVVMYGNYLPRLLTQYQIEVRKAELEK